MSLRRTPLFEQHQALGARLVDFGGWEMPVQYTSILKEHAAVREAAGLFDVSHMGVFEVRGADAEAAMIFLMWSFLISGGQSLSSLRSARSSVASQPMAASAAP